VSCLAERTKSLADLRRSEGRELSKANRERIASLRLEMLEMAKGLESLGLARDLKEGETLRQAQGERSQEQTQGDSGGKLALEALKKIYIEIQEEMSK
jgi:hypothetical protein